MGERVKMLLQASLGATTKDGIPGFRKLRMAPRRGDFLILGSPSYESDHFFDHGFNLKFSKRVQTLPSIK